MLADTAAIAVRAGLNILANIHANIPASILANHHQHAHRLAKLLVGACKCQASPYFRPLPQFVLDNQR
jgi:hypothetical protein